jgi:S1-C subfamily serine protease
MTFRHTGSLALIVLLVVAMTDHALAQSNDTQSWNGMTLKCTKAGYLGMQEEGLEVIGIEPDSAAESAGLRGPMPAATPAATPGSFLSRLEGISIPQASAGDLIVSINAHRVHCNTDLPKETANLKPGDTVYLVVIRSLPDGRHMTKRVSMRETSGPVPANNPAASQ